MTQENLDLMGFDDVQTTRPSIPNGDYHLKVVGPTLEDTKDKLSKYISYDAVVQSGEHKGYRVFNGIFSLKRENVWQLRRDMKAVGFDIPEGLTILEAAQYIVENINGFEVMASVGSKPATVKSDNGEYVDDPDGGRQNTIKRWLSAAVA